jgi:AcrR family transcriptional regulator
MARLTREESQMLTRERLLDAAMQVFASNGYEGASVDRIAEQAGYSKGAVYSNFSSKEELFLELLKRHMSNEIAELHRLLDRSSSAAEILQALKKKYGAMDKKLALPMIALEFQLQAGRNPEFGEPFAELYRNQRKAIAELIIYAAKKAGVPAPANANEIAIILMAVTHGIAMQRAVDPRSVPATTAGTAIQIYLSQILDHRLSKPKANS